MARKRPKQDEKHPDRFLICFARQLDVSAGIPKGIVGDGFGFIKKSLKTSDRFIARKKRDVLEAADDAQWAALLAGSDERIGPPRSTWQRSSMRRLWVSCTGPVMTSSRPGRFTDMLERVEAVPERGTKRDVIAAGGLLEKPPVLISDAFRIYCEEIVPHELVRMSPSQKASWKKVKLARAQQLHQGGWRQADSLRSTATTPGRFMASG